MSYNTFHNEDINLENTINIPSNELFENRINNYKCYICYENLKLNKDLFFKNNKLYKYKYCNCIELHVHKECLKKWINTKKEQNNVNYNYCEICNNEYNLQNKVSITVYIVLSIAYTFLLTILIFFIVNLSSGKNTYNSKLISSFVLSTILIIIFINLFYNLIKIFYRLKFPYIRYIELLDNIR
jgi:hypothetical protein